jgi:multicomponent Na+:H+ antiporter subunit E
MLPLTNIILTLVWAGLLGEISLSTLGTGFVLSYGILYLLSRGQPGHSHYFGRVPRAIGFALYYLYELVKSNVIVAYDIITPTHHMKPGVVAIPLEAKTDFEITLLANLISMTPGTLSLDISHDRKVLFVHAMYIDDPEAIRREITEKFERRVLEILR